MLLEIVQGARVQQVLRDEMFLQEWKRVHEQCAWASAFMRPEFAAAWYASYQHRSQPLLVAARDPNDGRVVGMMPLALGPDSQIVGVGAWQAEYQGWICAPDLDDHFPARAIDALRKAFPETTLRLCYLP